MLQANANAGMTEFWRQATIGDTFNRTTGENLPLPLLSLASSLGPDSTVDSFEGPKVLPRLAGEVLPWPRDETWSHDRVGAVNTGHPATDLVAPQQAWWQAAVQDQLGLPHWAEDSWADSAPFEGHQAEGGGAGELHEAQLGQFPGDTAGAMGSEDPKDPHEGEAGHWVNELGDPVLAPYGTPTFWLTARRWVPDYPPPPPPPPTPTRCCCCVKGVYVENEDAHEAKAVETSPKHRYLSNTITVVIDLEQRGKGPLHKCEMDWFEHTTRKFQGATANTWLNMSERSGTVRLGDTANDPADSDKIWESGVFDNWKSYERNKSEPCVDKKIRLTDRPKVHVSASDDESRYLWIVVCAHSAKDCDCANKKKCLTIVQRIVRNDSGEWKASLFIGDKEIEEGVKGDRRLRVPPGRPSRD